jgi:hypothetical protein
MKLLKIIGFGAFIVFSSSLWANAQVKPDTTHRKVDTTVHKKPTSTSPSKNINTDTVYRQRQPGQAIPPVTPPKPPSLMKPDTAGEHPKK